jgi:hypothetical protein
MRAYAQGVLVKLALSSIESPDPIHTMTHAICFFIFVESVAAQADIGASLRVVGAMPTQTKQTQAAR